MYQSAWFTMFRKALFRLRNSIRAKRSRADARDESETDDLDIKTKLSDARDRKKNARRKKRNKEVIGIMPPSNESHETAVQTSVVASSLIIDETQTTCYICFSTELDHMIHLESCTHGAHFECLKVSQC